MRDNSIEPDVVEYMKEPLDAATVAELCQKLGKGPAEIIRKKEYRALGLAETDDDAELMQRIAAHPEILERDNVAG